MYRTPIGRSINLPGSTVSGTASHLFAMVASGPKNFRLKSLFTPKIAYDKIYLMSYKQIIKFSDRSEDFSEWYYALLVFSLVLIATVMKVGGWL